TQGASRRGLSLPLHLERAVMRLTSARAAGTLGEEADELIDQVSQELDRARSSRGVRGTARHALMTRLRAIDAEIVRVARATLDEASDRALQGEAEADLTRFRATMAAEAYDRARG